MAKIKHNIINGLGGIFFAAGLVQATPASAEMGETSPPAVTAQPDIDPPALKNPAWDISTLYSTFIDTIFSAYPIMAESNTTVIIYGLDKDQTEAPVANSIAAICPQPMQISILRPDKAHIILDNENTEDTISLMNMLVDSPVVPQVLMGTINGKGEIHLKNHPDDMIALFADSVSNDTVSEGINPYSPEFLKALEKTVEDLCFNMG